MLPADYGGKKPKLNYTSADWYPVIQDLQNFIAGECQLILNLHNMFYKLYFIISDMYVLPN